MSHLICLTFKFDKAELCLCVFDSTLQTFVCVSVCVCVGGGHHSTEQLETSRSWTILLWPHPHSQHCKLHIRQLFANTKAVITETSDFPFSWVHGSIALAFSMSRQSRWDWSALNLSSTFPRILWAYWSLTVCTCAFAALCFILLILTRRRFVSSEQAGCPLVQIYVPCLEGKKSLPSKVLTSLYTSSYWITVSCLFRKDFRALFCCFPRDLSSQIHHEKPKKTSSVCVCVCVRDVDFVVFLFLYILLVRLWLKCNWHWKSLRASSNINPPLGHRT